MDQESQANIMKIAEDEKSSADHIIVVLGARDIEGAAISAETVTVGDPSYTGPLAGVSLRLPVYHILEPKVRDWIPKDVYDENAGIMAMVVDTEELGKQFKAIRERGLGAG
ncbi:hypothetical protein LCGC14_2385730 [marine sediment metagenome]|uniref:Glycine/sarcosine/betaine reductase complex protein A n=1 Tax=marine sediment metagenome TaxID=412755 RepID=A0A0F9EUA6_9ZZZZ